MKPNSQKHQGNADQTDGSQAFLQLIIDGKAEAYPLPNPEISSMAAAGNPPNIDSKCTASASEEKR